MTESRIGVGFIGAGPVVQAIHIPVLQSLSDKFTVSHIMDIDLSLAEKTARLVDAKFSNSLDALLADPTVHVVAICSPHRFHAEQIARAAEAGKRAVFCEKPLSTSNEELEQIRSSIETSGMLLSVGAMLAYDPAYLAAIAEFETIGGNPDLVKVQIFIPDNGVLVNSATQLISTAPAPTKSQSSKPTNSQMIVEAILGLVSHNIPHIRRLANGIPEIRSAKFIDPFGFELSWQVGSTFITTTAYMTGTFDPQWRLQAIAPEAVLEVQFPPSYVLAGSSVATVSTGSKSMEWRLETSGYEAEWQDLWGQLVEGQPAAVSSDAALRDIEYTLRLAAGASALIGETEVMA